MSKNDDFGAIGKAITEPQFSHTGFGGKEFYTFYMFTKRTSGAVDMFRCVVPDELVGEVEQGKEIEIYGEIRTRNYYDGENRHMMVYVLVKEVYTAKPEAISCNSVTMEGYIAKTPVLRATPGGKQICDFILAVNHFCGKSSYIPCICWEKAARITSRFEVGTHIRIEGRLQSREYHKKFSDNEYETRTAYEVSAGRIEAVKEAEGEKDESRD